MTLSDRYGDLDIEDIDENRSEDGEYFFGLEPDDEREIDFDKTFQRGEVRSFEADFGYELDSTLSDMETFSNDPEWSDEISDDEATFIEEFEQQERLLEVDREAE